MVGRGRSMSCPHLRSPVRRRSGMSTVANHALSRRTAARQAVRRLWVVVLLGLAWWPRAAMASCPEKAVPEALGIRLDEATLRKLVDVGLEYLPEVVEVPPAEWEIFSCPFGTAAAVGTDITRVRYNLLSHEVTLEADALRVTARVNLLIDGEAEAKLCDIPTDCRLEATVQEATITARVRPALDDCELRGEFEDVQIQVDSERVEVELSECSIVPTVVDLVLWGFQSIILEITMPYLEDYIVEEVPRLIQQAQVGVVLPSYSAFGVDVIIAADSVRFDGNSVQVTARAWSEPTGPVAACVPPGSSLEVDATTPEPLDVGLAEGDNARLVASQEFLQQLLLSAWGSGLFCFDLETLGVDLETPLEPIFPGVTLSTEVRSASAPQLTLDQQGGRDVLLEVEALEADVHLSLPGDEPVVARARTGASISGRVVVDPAATSIAIEPVDLKVLPASVELPTRSLPIRPEGLEKLFDDTLSPLLFGETGRLVILDAIFAGAPVALELTEVLAQDRFLQVGLRVWAKTPDDTTPPLTAWAPSALAGPMGASVPIQAASTDDLTPDSMMRHRVTIDGIPEEAIRPGQRFTLFGLESGWRTIEIRAVDLNDNVGEPVAVDVFVDQVPPEVMVTEGPLGVINRRSAVWRVEATDDHSPPSALTASYLVEAWYQGTSVVLAEGSFQLGQPLRLDDLPEDRVVAVRFTVEDEAGNQGEATNSFVADETPTLGCSASSVQPGWPLILGALVVLVRRRRGNARG